MNLAVSPDFQSQTGHYLDGRQSANAHAQAYDAEARGRLAVLSLQLTAYP